MIDLDMLVDIHNRFQQADPLEQKGIASDWVCVIHPSMEWHILDFKWPSMFDYLPSYQKLERILCRKVFIQDHAPINKIEYMDLNTWAGRYADEELAKIELKQEIKAKEDFEHGLNDYLAEG